MTGDRGQVAIFVLGLALVCFAISGVTIDGTRAFLFRRTLQNSADAAALAGAAELDRRSYYSSGGADVGVATGPARAAAVRWLARRGLDARAAISVGEAEVGVVLRGDVPTTFLGLVGVSSLPVSVQATAAPVAGKT